jgi:hypothetical protein
MVEHAQPQAGQHNAFNFKHDMHNLRQAFTCSTEYSAQSTSKSWDSGTHAHLKVRFEAFGVKGHRGKRAGATLPSTHSVQMVCCSRWRPQGAEAPLPRHLASTTSLTDPSAAAGRSSGCLAARCTRSPHARSLSSWLYRYAGIIPSTIVSRTDPLSAAAGRLSGCSRHDAIQIPAHARSLSLHACTVMPYHSSTIVSLDRPVSSWPLICCLRHRCKRRSPAHARSLRSACTVMPYHS